MADEHSDPRQEARRVGERLARAQPPSIGEFLIWREVLGFPAEGERIPTCLSVPLVVVLAVLMNFAQAALKAPDHFAALVGFGAVVCALLDARTIRVVAWVERRLLARRKRRPGRALRLLGRFELVLLATLFPLAYAADWTGSAAIAALLANALGAAIVLYVVLWQIHIIRAMVGAGREQVRWVTLAGVLRRGEASGGPLGLAIALAAFAAVAHG